MNCLHGLCGVFCFVVILTLPDDPALQTFTSEELRLDLACGLFAAGSVSRGVAARIAGVDRATFDEALFVRHIPSYTGEMLDQDLAALRENFGG